MGPSAYGKRGLWTAIVRRNTRLGDNLSHGTPSGEGREAGVSTEADTKSTPRSPVSGPGRRYYLRTDVAGTSVPGGR